MITTDRHIQVEDTFVLVPIIHMLKHPGFFKNVSTYIKASDKYIRLNYAEDSYEEILSSLLSKGGTHVYLTEHDLSSLLSAYQEKMGQSDVAFDDEVSRELLVKENETVIMLAQAFIKNSGLSPEVTKMVESANRQVYSLINKSPNIKALLDSFRKNCSDEFFKITFTNYICSMILSTFPWKTPLILDKLMLAGTLCDLALDADSIAEFEEFEHGSGPLTERVRNHPLTVVDIIKADPAQISLETITIIKQHHERPDGKGFPFGLDHTRINQLSTIFIVAHNFVDRVCESEHEGITYLESAEKLRQEFSGGFFTKTCIALVTEIAKLR